LEVEEVSDTWAYRTALILAKGSCNTTGNCHYFTCSRLYPAGIYGLVISNKLKKNSLIATDVNAVGGHEFNQNNV
jgi:hypothetical protein